VIKQVRTWELEGGQVVRYRDFLLFFTDKSSLPDGFIDSPSFDGSFYAAFQTSTGLFVAIGILVLVIVAVALPTVVGILAMMGMRAFPQFTVGTRGCARA
jgi:hypothetical protein